MFSYINFLNNPLRDETLANILNNIGELPFLALPPVPVLETTILPSPWWTVGFVVGEGSFSYKKVDRTTISTDDKRSFYYLTMSINQLKFDKYIHLPAKKIAPSNDGAARPGRCSNSLGAE